MPSPSSVVPTAGLAVSDDAMIGMVFAMLLDLVVDHFKRWLAGVCFAAHIELGRRL